jgi:glutamate carboxypeptidase
MAEPARGEPLPAEPALGEPALGEPALGEPALGEPALGEPPLGRDGEAALAAAAARLARLVRLESPSGDVARLDALRDVLARRLTELGGAVELVPGDAGDHIRAAFPAGPAPAGGHILVVGHYDTVWEAGWLASHPFTLRGTVATGPGVLDMKGAIVALELAFEMLKGSGRTPAQPVQVVLVADEEVSSPHGRTVVMDAAGGAAAVVGLEPPHPDGGLKTGRRGVARVRIEVHGREAHAGLAVADGVSAIDELLDQLARLREALPRAADFGWNIGRVSGGTRANVIAGRASAEVGLRFATRQTERACLGAVEGLTPVRPGARVRAEVLFTRPAWPAEPGNRLAEHVIGLAARLGERVGARPAAGAGDTNFTGAAGLPTVDGLGPRGRGAHSPAESVRVDSILRRAELLAALFSTPLPPLGG